MVAGMLLVVWAFRNIYGCTLAEGQSFADPVLRCDDKVYYLWALHYYDGSVSEPDTKFVGFPLMILLSWKLLGHSIVWPIAINVMLTLLTVVLTGQTAGRALADRVRADRGTITFLAMLVTSLLGFFMSHAAMLLKEPLTYFAVALAAYAIARMKEIDEDSRGSVWHDIALFTIAVALMSIVRTSVIYFLLGHILVEWIQHGSADAHFGSHRHWRRHNENHLSGTRHIWRNDERLLLPARMAKTAAPASDLHTPTLHSFPMG